MPKSRLRPLLVFAAMQIVPATAAFAALPQTFVSRYGSDSNDCSINAPCRTLGRAIGQTIPTGEAVILDSISLGTAQSSTFIIANAITIRALGGGSELSGRFEIEAGASDKVELDGIGLFGGAQTGGASFVGIDVRSGGEILVRNCHIRGYQTQASFPNLLAAGIYLRNTSGSVRMTIENSVIADNTHGIVIGSSPNLGHVRVLNSQILSNDFEGIAVIGAGNNAVISNTQFFGNPKALAFSNGGSATSYGNNIITNGDMPTKVPLN